MFNFSLILLFTTSFANSILKFLAHKTVQYKPDTTSIPRELNIIKRYLNKDNCQVSYNSQMGRFLVTESFINYQRTR